MIIKSRIAFLGDSLTNEGNWHEYFPNQEIANFGISGEKSEEIISRIDEVIFWKPSKIFLMMGINDLGGDLNYEEILKNYQIILSKIRGYKEIELIVQNLLPTNDTMFKSINFDKMNILEVNLHLRDLCEIEKVIFVDLYTAFSTYTYQLIKDYTYDGLHLNEAGYKIWKNCLQSQNLI